MSFTKQTPTKPGAYWFSTGQYKDKQLVEIYESGSRLFAWRHKMGFVEREWHNWEGEWCGPLVPAEDLAKAQAQCAELRSEVEKAWHEGFIDGDFGEARADDCWNQSRARKVATGEQP